MTDNLYAELAWLPKAPDDFYQRCKELISSSERMGKEVQALASFSLDFNQLERLAKAIGKLRGSGGSVAPLTPFKLGLLSNSTVDFIVPALVASAARHGIDLHCIPGHYDQVVQDAIDPTSAVNKADLDAILVAIDYRGLPLHTTPGDREAAQSTIEAVKGHLATIRDGLRKNSRAICIFQTIAAPPESLFGSIERALPGAMRNLIDAINLSIAESVAATEDVILDVAAIAETVGLGEWHCPRQWNLGKLPFSDTYLPLYADHVSRVIAAMRGKSRRCLILDLDNTLWGGIIGDDGLEGIRVAQGDAAGEAYLSVQRMALSLRDRGVVLAVSSKNEDEIARSPFRKHPEMLLREDHFAVFQANWNDKATNIKAIAGELALGLESMVLLDDNPVERGLVREILPQVAVPELPEDPALYARTLAAAGYFEAVLFSKEDAKRADYYQDNARRVALQKQAGDIDAYLASLDMEITFQPFDETGRARITQLINKSNQYNLTTRRYSETDTAATEHDPACYTLQVRLKDRFGDNGMISVVICRPASGRVWDVDTWLMSCRVIGRRVENMVLQEILNVARERGITQITGKFIPTERNKLVVDHYAKLGFIKMSEEADGTTSWSLDVATAQVQEAPIRVERFGFSQLAVARD
jgi:FkbH-like protein